MLVVETTRVNYPYFDREGTPQSDQVAFEERFTVVLAEGEEPARLDYRLTATDPVMFAEPLVIETAFNWSSARDDRNQQLRDVGALRGGRLSSQLPIAWRIHMELSAGQGD